MPMERTMSASTRAGGRLKSSVVVQRLEQLVRVARVHTVRLEVARHVGADQPQLAGRGGQVGGAARGHQVETRAASSGPAELPS